MNYSDTLGSRIYFDTNIYIYTFEGGGAYKTALARLLEYTDHPEVRVIGGQVLLPELLAKPLQDKNQALYERYWELLTGTESIELVSLNQDIYMSSAALRGQYNLKTLDALHLATAIAYNCTCFVTNDKKLSRVSQIPIIQLDTF